MSNNKSFINQIIQIRRDAIKNSDDKLADYFKKRIGKRNDLWVYILVFLLMIMVIIGTAIIIYKLELQEGRVIEKIFTERIIEIEHIPQNNTIIQYFVPEFMANCTKVQEVGSKEFMMSCEEIK